MILELRHLRSLKAINETGNLATAAQRLHLTQSALSHQIKVVEHYFGILLYERKHKPLKLTLAGQRLLNLAQQILPLVEVTEIEIQRMAGAESGRLHITIECHSCFEWLIPVLDQYRQRWPEVEVDIRLANNFDALPVLSHGDVDLVITSDRTQQNNIRFEPLFDYQAFAVLANDHSLSDKPWLNPEDFAQETLITYPVEQNRLDIFNYFLNPNNVSPKQIRQSELTTMILQLVASRRGIAVLPNWVLDDYITRQYVTAKQLGESGLHGTLFAAIRQAEANQDYLKDFLQMAKDGLSMIRNQPGANRVPL